MKRAARFALGLAVVDLVLWVLLPVVLWFDRSTRVYGRAIIEVPVLMSPVLGDLGNDLLLFPLVILWFGKGALGLVAGVALFRKAPPRWAWHLALQLQWTSAASYALAIGGAALVGAALLGDPVRVTHASALVFGVPPLLAALALSHLRARRLLLHPRSRAATRPFASFQKAPLRAEGPWPYPMGPLKASPPREIVVVASPAGSADEAAPTPPKRLNLDALPWWMLFGCACVGVAFLLHLPTRSLSGPSDGATLRTDALWGLAAAALLGLAATVLLFRAARTHGSARATIAAALGGLGVGLYAGWRLTGAATALAGGEASAAMGGVFFVGGGLRIELAVVVAVAALVTVGQLVPVADWKTRFLTLTGGAAAGFATAMVHLSSWTLATAPALQEAARERVYYATPGPGFLLTIGTILFLAHGFARRRARLGNPPLED